MAMQPDSPTEAAPIWRLPTAELPETPEERERILQRGVREVHERSDKLRRTSIHVLYGDPEQPSWRRLVNKYRRHPEAGEGWLAAMSLAWGLLLISVHHLFVASGPHYEGIALHASEMVWGTLLLTGALSLGTGLILGNRTARGGGLLALTLVWTLGAAAQVLGGGQPTATPIMFAGACALHYWVLLIQPTVPLRS